MVVNRNLTSTGLRDEPTGEPGTFDLEDAAAIARDAWDLGATELCVQGMIPASLDPARYLDIARTVKAAAPGLHLHAYRPQDVVDFADRSGVSARRGARGAARGRRRHRARHRGQGAERARAAARRARRPRDRPLDRGHRGRPRRRLPLHLGALLRPRRDRRRAHRAPADAAPPAGAARRASPSSCRSRCPASACRSSPDRAPVDEHRAMVAVSRLLLAGSIPHIQIPWTRMAASCR